MDCHISGRKFHTQCATIIFFNRFLRIELQNLAIDELDRQSTIRAIELYEQREKSCGPSSNVIIEGGVGEKYATLEVIAPTGCNSNARVSFPVQRY